MIRIKICTSLTEAEGLYHRFCPNPTNMFQTWEVRSLLFDVGHDSVFFLHTDEALLPLQVGEIGIVEWFGGHLMEDQSWLGNLEHVDKLVGFMSPLFNELDQISAPLPGHTDPSIMPSFYLPLPLSHDAWLKGLKKKRRWEIRQVTQQTEVEFFPAVTVETTRQLLKDGIRLSLESYEHREKPEDCYYHPEIGDHFSRIMERFLVWAASHGILDAVIRAKEGKIVSIAFGCRDTISPIYHWIFGSTDTSLGSSTGKSLISDVVQLVCDNYTDEVDIINGFSDEIGPGSLKGRVGFLPKAHWTLSTSDSGYRRDPDNEDLAYVRDAVALHLPSYCPATVINRVNEWIMEESEGMLGFDLMDSIVEQEGCTDLDALTQLIDGLDYEGEECDEED